VLVASTANGPPSGGPCAHCVLAFAAADGEELPRTEGHGKALNWPVAASPMVSVATDVGSALSSTTGTTWALQRAGDAAAHVFEEPSLAFHVCLLVS
jgi:hypothetical protein